MCPISRKRYSRRADKADKCVRPFAEKLFRVVLPEDLGSNGDARDLIESGRIKELEQALIDSRLGIDLSKYPDHSLATIQRAKEIVMECFPHLWEGTEACLATICSLILEDCCNPIALVLQGEAGTGKSTILSMFEALKELVYRSDDFSPKAFVSHSSTTKKSELAVNDLLPKIRYRCLLTSDLNPLFGAPEPDMKHNLSIVTRVLDGRGFTSDKGTHGQRGYVGDYPFSWIAACTPIDLRVFHIMGSMGSRLLFLMIEDHLKKYKVQEKSRVMTDEQLAKEIYQEKVKACQKIVTDLVVKIWRDMGGVRGFNWRAEGDLDPFMLQQVALHAQLMATMRSTVTIYRDEKRIEGKYSQARLEAPTRAMVQLVALARSRALCYGRRYLDEDDVGMIAKIAHIHVDQFPSWL